MPFEPPLTQPEISICVRQALSPIYDGNNHSNLRSVNPVTSIYGLGHSLLSHHTPRMLAAMSESDGNELADWNYSWVIGSPLRNHLENYRSIDPPGSTFTRNSVVSDRWDTQLASGYDAFVMTEAVSESLGVANHIEWSGTVATTEALFEIAKSGNPDCAVWMMETAMDQNPSIYPTLDDWYAAVRGEHLIAWNSIRELLDPEVGDLKMLYVGQAFADLYVEVQAGTITGITDFTYFFEDLIHPNDIGFYFQSCVMYAYIFGKTPVGLAYSDIDDGGFSTYDAPDATLATELQLLAWVSYNEHKDMI